MKEGITVNQEWKNKQFNLINDNEALAIEIELQNGEIVILATIYCPNGNPSLRLFKTISNKVIFLWDINSKHKQFGCVIPNKSGQTLVNIAKDLKLFDVNQLSPNRHKHEDPVHGTSDISDMAFLSPGLSSWDISFSVADDHMGSDHFPIQISLDKPLKWNTLLTEPCYRFDKTDDDLLHHTQEDSLSSIETDIATQDELKELAVTPSDIKFSGITFDNRMTFIKHFEEISECCNQKFHCLRILVNEKWGPSPTTILQIYKQCVRPIFEYGIVSIITVSESVIDKIQRVQNSFIG